MSGLEMLTITIHDLPDDTYASLEARAARARLSLEEYVRGELIRIAGTAGAAGSETKAEVLRRARERVARTGTHLTVEQILEARDADRR
jgi:plasmid stability protein